MTILAPGVPVEAKSTSKMSPHRASDSLDHHEDESSGTPDVDGEDALAVHDIDSGTSKWDKESQAVKFSL